MKEGKIYGLSYVKFFLFFLLATLILAFAFRGIYSYKDRAFTNNSLNVLVASRDNLSVVGMDEKAKTMSVMILKDRDLSKNNIMMQSVMLGVPLHASISYPDSAQMSPSEKGFFSFSNLVNIYTSKSIKRTNLTLFDLSKIFFLTKAVEEKNRRVISYNSIKELDGFLLSESAEVFVDSDLAYRKPTLEVINATGVTGLGSKIGAMFSRTGFNVVSVESSDEPGESAIYYANEKERDDAELIRRAFDFPIAKRDGSGVSQLTLVIGEESALQFEQTK